MSGKNSSKETPLMKQYNAIKTKHPDALLLFRVGDFYETFGEDAIKTAKILGIVLTARNNGDSKLELAGFPYHSLENYLPKLVRAGQRVAICEQLEDPKMTKTIVKRGVTELVSPGISYSDNVLQNKSNNFLATVHFEKNTIGVAFLDVSTGEFLVAEGNLSYIDRLLQQFNPSEVLYQRNKNKEFTEAFGEKFHAYFIDEWVFKKDYCREILTKQFGTKSLKGFGIEDMEAATIAAGVTFHYLKDTQHNEVRHINGISRIEEDKFVWIDKFTSRNLELFHSPNENARTLIDVIDKTISPMGSRLMKRWLALPLKDKSAIESRLDVVQHFSNDPDLTEALSKHVKFIGDIERLISKVSVGKVNPKEVIYLKNGLKEIDPIKKLCKGSSCEELNKLSDMLLDCSFVINKIEKEIQEEPPALVSKGNAIKEGVSAELDELRKIAYSGKDFVLQIQQREIENTGIPSLKIGFNNVFGYFLEVTHIHTKKVPSTWIRKQTLSNAERYITEELKEYESKILGAEEKILSLETEIYQKLVASLAEFIQPVQHNAAVIARLDCLLSFSKLARESNYCRPTLISENKIEIKGGRHPVIETLMPVGESYISNDLFLDTEEQQIIMITGPNMAGKSALLRQTALIVILAQIGCFVPADSAKLGITDKVFTRVGASDNISQGESTFMVEMNETASILNNLSGQSLILLDEIGRGTSTYDGVSIAWSIAEFLHEHKFRPRTLFATHYHELNEMTQLFPRIKNFNVSVKELEKKIIFMRKLVPGGSHHSFGIHVAEMAGMPKSVVKRANQKLEELEARRGSAKDKKQVPVAIEDNFQLSFFQLDDPVLSQIKEEIIATDINTLTPVEALFKLNEIKKLVGG